MHQQFSIKQNEVHLWQVSMPDLFFQLPVLEKLLSREECERANKFHFKEHRDRFIVARGMLRQILALYTNVLPDQLNFQVTEHGKPYLTQCETNVYFNVSHSKDRVIYGLSQSAELGVDIEKCEVQYHDAVAKRVFSPAEYQQLALLPELSKSASFYQLWAAKEAVIKALGKGLFVPLDEFSIDILSQKQTLNLTHQQKVYRLDLQYLAVDPDYKAAIAVGEPVLKIVQWIWNGRGYRVC